MNLTRLPQKGGTYIDRNVYQGHVVLRQGPITIWADTTVLRLNAHGFLLFARALGHPVRFVRLSRRGPPIRGTALVVTYDPGTTTYTLLGQVHVHRGPQSIVAHEITYNTTTRILVAHRGRRHRVRMVIPPHPGRP
jgi:lipopolysaccharide transport protein LptA